MERQDASTISATFLVFLLLLLTVGFRIARLTADPPSNFSWSGGYFADEGYWSHNARNYVLFGKPVMDEWDARVVSPVFASVQEYVFLVFGVGLAQVRLVGILSSILIAIASFQLFRKQFDDGFSFFCALLVSLNYPMLVLGRQGILDPFAAAPALCGMALLFTESRAAAFAAGILLAASCLTKYLMIYTFVPFAFVVIFVLRPTKGIILSILGGFFLAASAWLLFNYIPNGDLLGGYSRYYSSQQSWQLFQVTKNVVLQPFYLYFVKTPAILFLGNLMLWYLLSRLREAGKVERVCWVWLVSGILFFALWRYRPMRYYTSLIPPLAALAGMSLLRIDGIVKAFRFGRTRFLLWLGLLIPALQIGFVLCDRWFGWQMVPEQLGIQTWDALIFLMFTAVAAVILLGAPQESRLLVLAFVIAFLSSDLKNYLVWMLNPQYAAVEISEELQRRIGKGVITGQWAPELCLENDLQTVPVWHGFVNDEDPFNKYGITHMILWRYPLGDEVEKFQEWYPEEFRKFHPVARYIIKDSELALFEKK